MNEDQKIRLICGVISALNSVSRNDGKYEWLLIPEEQIRRAADQLHATQVGTVLNELGVVI